MEFYQIAQDELDSHTKQMSTANRPAERVSVSQSLKHFVRDWAVSGANERNAAFPCILKALMNLQRNHRGQERLKVVLPGAGLGRLGHEVAKLGGEYNPKYYLCLPVSGKSHSATGLPGFDVTNNEWSMYQNIAYRFLENNPRRDGSVIHPFIDSWSHHRTTADMLRAVSFPEVSLNSSAVVLVEGDFTTVFHDNTSAFDIVITHFFIDTARNLVSYLDTIFRILKPGGYWINLGPLLYGSAPFVQLSLDEIITVAEAMGFVFQEAPVECGTVSLPGKAVRGLEAVYGFDETALTKNAYDAQFWVAQRPLPLRQPN